MELSVKQLGAAGELAAAKKYMSDGYRVLECNYHSRYGEIDIIASGKGCIIFAEVKLRVQGSRVSPAQAVTYNKQQKLIITAQRWLLNNPCELQPRFDVVEVIHRDGEILSVERIEDAFRLN